MGGRRKDSSLRLSYRKAHGRLRKRNKIKMWQIWGINESERRAPESKNEGSCRRSQSINRLDHQGKLGRDSPAPN